MRKLAVVMALVLLMAVASFARYPDVDPEHWAYESVMNVTNAGLFEGYPDGTFKGNQAMTRYEYAMVVNRFLNYVDSADNRLQELIYSFAQKIEEIEPGIPVDLAEFEGKLKMQAEEIASLKRRATDLEITTKLLGQSLAKQTNRLADFEKEIHGKFAELEFAYSVAFDQIDANIARIDENAAKLEEFEGALDEKASLEALNALKDSYDALISTVALDVYKLSRTKADKEALNEMDRRLSALDGRVDDLGSELDDVTFAIFDFMDANTNLTFARIHDIEDEISMLDAKIDGVKIDLDETTEIIFDFMDANVDLTFARINEIEEEVAGLEDKYAELDAKIESNTNFLYKKISIIAEDQTKEIDALKGSVSILDDSVRAIRRDLTDLSMTVKILGQASAAQNRKIGELSVGIADNRADLGSLRLDMEELADLAYRTSDDLSALSRLTYMMLDVLTEEIEELDAKKADREDLEVFESKVDAVDARVDSVEDETEEIRKTQDQMRTEIKMSVVLSLAAIAVAVVGLLWK